MYQPRRSVMPTPVRGGSNLPVPATQKKQETNMRMSMAGPPSRALPRQSLHPQAANHLLHSASKPKYGQQLNSSQQRRTSMWQGGSQGAPSSSQPTKDPRPLRDRAYQNKNKQAIVSFLHSIEFENAREAMATMTGQSYRLLFNRLIQWLDPEYPIGLHRIEEEFMPALKAFRYPFAHTVDVKWLSAPASMHCWPGMLGILSWLNDMCFIKLQYLKSNDPALLEVEGVPDQFDDPMHHAAVAWELNVDAYNAWIYEDDNWTEPRQVFENRYALKDEKAQMENGDLAQKCKTLQKDLERLRSSATPLADLQKTNEILKNDDQKFDAILKKYEAAIKKKKDQLQRDKEDYASSELQLGELQAESRRLTSIVSTQNLSQQQVLKMNTDHDSLTRTLDELRTRISESHQSLMTLEVACTNRASKAEDALESYTSLLTSLDMFPPLPPAFGDVDLTLELNTATENTNELLVGSDIRKVVKPAILKFAEMKRAERARVASEQLGVENELDKVTTECELLEEAIAGVERDIEHVTEQAEDIKEASQRDTNISNSEQEKLERELQRVRAAAISSGMGVKTQLQSAQFKAREQEAKIVRLKQETLNAVIQSGSNIAGWKDSIAKHLSEVQAFAKAEESG